ncbi:MAG: hypothetical protein NTU60_06730 [Candidatus Aminicenantes bacterium]|nr:hypothetical protein [Candidatus Aminicenantes bacterium]
MDTTKYANGVHTIYWIATDDAGQADGIGSRYFSVVNTGASAGTIGDMDSLHVPDLADILDLPPSFDPLSIKRGLHLTAPPERVVPDNFGTIHIETKELERIELDLGKGRSYRGFLIVGGQLRPLPIGSTLDPRTGRFSWLPGPGFFGSYDLIFIREDGFGGIKKISLTVRIQPKFKN